MLEDTIKVIFLYFGLIFVAVMVTGFLITVVHVFKEFFADLFEESRRKKGARKNGHD